MPNFDPYQAAPAYPQYMQQVPYTLMQGDPAQGSQGMPAQGMPMQGVPMQGAPMQGAPMQGITMQGYPQGAQAAGLPVQGYPQGAQAAGLPMQGYPGQGFPMQGGQGLPLPGTNVPGMPDAVSLQQYVYPVNMQDALKLIEGAVEGEKEDRQFYEYLISTAPSEEDKEIIRGIRDDEIRHFGLFRLIYYQLTGQVLPPPKETPFIKPASYCAGLRRAIQGETGAVVKYRKILYAMQNRIHINMLTGIITDELRHGILYSSLYAKNGCKT